MIKINKYLFNFILGKPSILNTLLKYSNFENFPMIQKLRNRYISKAIEGIYSAGENLQEAEKRIIDLEKKNIGVILNYSMESANNIGIKKMQEEYNKIVQCLEKHKHSCVALKPTALISSEQILQLSSFHNDVIYGNKIDFSPILKKSNIEVIAKPFIELTQRAIKAKTRILIDAEQSLLQPGVDLLALFLMQKFNRESVYIYNTYQLYLNDCLMRISAHKQWIQSKGSQFAAKLVRGAYLSHDRKFQKECHQNYRLCTDKNEVDANFNAAVLNLTRENDSSLVIATHNAESITLLKGIIESKNFRNIELAYLMGFGDEKLGNSLNIRCLEYVPYGPSEVKIPYLLRRLEENLSIFQNKV